MNELLNQPPLEPRDNQDNVPDTSERLGVWTERTHDQVVHDALFASRNGVSLRMLRAIEQRVRKDTVPEQSDV